MKKQQRPMTQNPRKKPKDKRKTAALAVALLVAAAIGIWLYASPKLEKQRLQQTQDQLVESIETGDGVISLEKPVANAAVDYYDPTPTPAASETPDADAPAEPEPIFWTESDELEDAEDAAPAVITGIGILTIEKIDLKMPVADDATTSNLKVSAGWVRETAQIGSIGNAVIAGHRNYDYGSHFNRLGEVEVGDEVGYISKNGEAMRFRVFEILEVLPGDQAAFEQPTDKAIITLLTCTPIRTATHRLLVRAELITLEGDSQ